VAKIAAMQEAADNILSTTTAQINGQYQDGGGLGLPGSSSSNVKGKSVFLSDISEEENPSLLQAIPKKSNKRATVVDPSEEQEDCRSSSEALNRSSLVVYSVNLEKDGQLEGESQSESYLEKSDVTRKNVCGSQVEIEMRQVQDTNLDEVEDDQDEVEVDGRRAGVTFDLGENDNSSDCRNDDEKDAQSESIPMKNLGKRQNKQHQKRQIQKPNPVVPGSASTSTGDKSESGLHSSKGKKQGEGKSQNHAGTGSSGGGNSKLVLDLDDKSRFTEEITV
jgi:hypothetical protein